VLARTNICGKPGVVRACHAPYSMFPQQKLIYEKENKMGWGRTLLLGDIGNRLDIEDTEKDIELLKKDIYAAY
jgi:hypothetical protein